MVIAVAAVLGAVVLLSGSKSKPKAGGRAALPGWESHYVGPTDRRYDANHQSLAFGMTKKQVLRIVGPPTRTVGNCWQYRINQYVSQGGDHSTFEADRLCFLAGKYSEQHTRVNGRWDPYRP